LPVTCTLAKIAGTKHNKKNSGRDTKDPAAIVTNENTFDARRF
jgi:hypothetical protein